MGYIDSYTPLWLQAWKCDSGIANETYFLGFNWNRGKRSWKCQGLLNGEGLPMNKANTEESRTQRGERETESSWYLQLLDLSMPKPSSTSAFSATWAIAFLFSLLYGFELAFCHLQLRSLFGNNVWSWPYIEYWELGGRPQSIFPPYTNLGIFLCWLGLQSRQVTKR